MAKKSSKHESIMPNPTKSVHTPNSPSSIPTSSQRGTAGGRPLWKGPEKDGITFSLLSRFLCCRERFRVLVVEGLKPAPSFNHMIEFGSMWHVCEEALAKKSKTVRWEICLQEYVSGLCKTYPLSQDEIEHWYEFCKAMFPIYTEYWSKHPDVKDRTPLMQEVSFDVPYSLPSGRVVRLRGKWDSVDLIGKGEGAGIYLQENKTKSRIDIYKIGRQLSFDLQTLMYIVALKHAPSSQLTKKKGIYNLAQGAPILGVRYNVIRRSAHKSVASMLTKLHEDMQDGRSAEWFCRWKVEIHEQDVVKFQCETLDPILEQLCDWWEYILKMQDCKMSPFGIEDHVAHWRHPFGVWNPMDQGAESELDEYLTTGSSLGLERTEDLFPELT